MENYKMEPDDSNDTSSLLEMSSDAASSNQQSSAIITAKLMSGQYVVSAKRGRSSVWNVFGKIEDEMGNEVEHFVMCRNCCNVYKFHGKSTSNLVKHKCYIAAKTNKANETAKVDVSSEEKRNIVQFCTQWAVENCRSFNLIEDSGLKKLIEQILSIGSKFGANVDVDKLLPQPITISRNIRMLYHAHAKHIKNELAAINGNGFGLTSDIWTDSYLRTSYMALTIHYIKDGRLINLLLGLSSMKGYNCTGDNIRWKAIDLLDEFGCSFDEKSAIVTDRGTNMVSAFSNYNQIYCINHLLHNALEKSMKEISEVTVLCDASTKLISFLTKSGSDSNLSINNFSPTRWNTVYYMLDYIVKNWVDIINILQEKNEIRRCDNINLNYVKTLIKILKPFEESSRDLECENYPTLHLTFVHINNLKKVCTTDKSDVNSIKSLKENLSNMLETVMQNLSPYHKVALFLFPPANKLVYFNDDEKQKIKLECSNMMTMFTNESYEDENESKPEPLPSTQKAKLFTDFVQPVEFNGPRDKISKELNAYENVNSTYYDEFNVLQWWHLHKAEFPLLYKVSCAIFAIPASSAASERAISKAKQLISEKRSALDSNPIYINEILFIHSNVDKNELVTDEM